jgi:AraC-like DNA-binding protein
MTQKENIGFARAEVAASMRSFLAQRYGIDDPDDLIRKSGLDPDTLGDFDTLMRLRAWVKFMDTAAAEVGDECLGIEFAKQVPFKDVGVLAYVMLNSPTLGAGLTAGCRFYATQQTLGKAFLNAGADEARLTYSLYDPSLGPTAQIKDSLIAFAVRYCREATGKPDWKPLRVKLERDAPPDTSCHEKFFGAPVDFSSHENAVVFPVGDLELPLKKADPGLLPILRRHAESLLDTMPVPGDISDQVRRALTQVLGTGDFDLEDVAKYLETDARTVKRSLSDAGTSFQEVLDDTRFALAKRYLKDPTLSLTEIAFLLGYSEMSAFSRAFSRWTDQSPKAWRQANPS